MSMPTYKLASRVKIPNFMTLTTFLIKTQIPIFLSYAQRLSGYANVCHVVIIICSNACKQKFLVLKIFLLPFFNNIKHDIKHAPAKSPRHTIYPSIKIKRVIVKNIPSIYSKQNRISFLFLLGMTFSIFIIVGISFTIFNCP